MINKKLQVWLPLVFSLVLITGMVVGFELHKQTGRSGSFFRRDKRGSLQEALDLIRYRYVDSVGIDSLQDNAISEVMNHLDPHSVYIPAMDVQSYNEDLEGNFEGIGIEFNIFSDTVHVLYVIPGGPSDRAGIQLGDRIIAVDDRSIVSKTLPSEDIRKMIRGKEGTKVKLSIVRNHTTQFKEVVRGPIPLPSLDAAYMIEGATGYIKLSKFSRTTHTEFMTALDGLQKQGMRKLVLDLRGNPGGFVDQAVLVADEFLDGDKMIVYTRGVNTPKEEYRAKKDGMFEKGPLVVLMDELSASASEILAGALQDWDRATIVGRRSYGKGLVQGQYDLSDGSAIRLTIARYYTPSGRSIQRPYGKGNKVYREELLKRFQNGETVNPDSIHYASDLAFKTLVNKRTVYGGGGISPDVFVPMDTTSVAQNVTKLYIEGGFNNYVYTYFTRHQNQFQQYRSPEDFAARFQNAADAWSGLVDYARRDSIFLQNIPDRDRVFLQNQIKAYLARLKWRTQGQYQVANSFDPVVLKAREVLK